MAQKERIYFFPNMGVKSTLKTALLPCLQPSKKIRIATRTKREHQSNCSFQDNFFLHITC